MTTTTDDDFELDQDFFDKAVPFAKLDKDHQALLLSASRPDVLKVDDDVWDFILKYPDKTNAIIKAVIS